MYCTVGHVIHYTSYVVIIQEVMWSIIPVTLYITQEAVPHDLLSDSKDQPTINTLVAPYPPGVVVKSNPDIPIQGSIYIKVCMCYHSY